MQELRRARDASFAGDIAVIEEVGGSQVDRDGLLMRCLAVSGQDEGTFQIGVEVEVPGEPPEIALCGTDGRAVDDGAVVVEETERCFEDRGAIGSGAGRCQLGAVVEGAISVVIDARGDVEGLIAAGHAIDGE